MLKVAKILYRGKQSNVLHKENDPAFITPTRWDLIDSDSEEGKFLFYTDY